MGRTHSFIRLGLFLCFAFLSIWSNASKVAIPFSALQHEMITCITSDTNGFLWIGTTKGIFMYDGSTLFKYGRNNGVQNSLRSSIYNMFFSKDGTLIAASTNGIYCYSPSKDEFEERVSNVGFSYVIDRFPNGHYLITDSYSKKIFIANADLSEVIHSTRLDLLVAMGKYLRLSNGNYCICGSSSFAIMTPDLEMIKTVELSSTITCASETMGRILIGTDDGFMTFSHGGVQVSNNATLDTYTQGHRVNFITQFLEDKVFVGITGVGIYCYDIETDRIRLISQQLSRELINRNFGLFHIDKNGQLWLRGNADRDWIGVTVLKTKPTYPDLEELFSMDYDMNMRVIELITLDNNGVLYAFTTKELLKFEDGKFIVIMPLPDKECKDMFFDKQGRLWLASSECIYVYSMKNGYPDLIKAFPEKGYMTNLHVVADDYVTFSLPGRLISFDNQLKMIKTGMPDYGMSPFICLEPNRKDIYVRLSYNYSASYNPFKGFWNETLDTNRNNINYQMRDSKGRLWLATDNLGAICYSSDSLSVDTLNVTSGLPDNMVYAVEEDNCGTIWITTTNGIAKYDPEKHKIYNYGEANGMLHDLRHGRMLKAPCGEIFLYSSTYVLKVLPLDSTVVFSPPKPIITSALINGKEFIGQPTRIKVSHDQNNIALRFVSVDMTRANLIRYEYMLKGHDNNWIEAGNNQNVIYNNLLPGQYSFLVRARYGTASCSEATELKIGIKPAFYQTTLFQIGVMLLALALIALFTRYVIRTKISIAESRFAVENERMKVDLYSRLSHLIRTPVSLINAPFQELVEGRKWDSHEQELIAVIRRSIDHIMDLTKQFLEHWSDADNQAVADTTLQLEVKDLSAIVRETALMFRPTASQAGISLSLEIPESLTVPIDEDKIIKILYNLVSNALRHTPRGGEVRISVARQNQTVTLSVADTGRGVPDVLKKKIFERFFSPDNKTGYHFGIGLYHTRRLVQLQGGTVEVRDNKPQGAIFTITLPLEQVVATPQAFPTLPTALPEEEEPDTAGQEAGATPGDDAKPHLLLVEDNSELLHYLAASLRRKYHVSTARDGMEALDLFAKEGIDLVVTDVMMPRMDGYALCRWVKESAEYCHIPVVILTAKSTKTDELEGLGCGADAYLTKPFDPTKLMVILNNLLENRKRIQAILLKRFAPDTPQPGEGGQEEEKTLKAAINEKDSAFMEKLYALLEEHLYDDQFNIARICQELGFSKTVLAKKIRALTGATPNQVVTEFRFSKVKELMATRKYTLSEIAYMTGFSSISTFSRRFRAIYNMSPTEYMRKNGLNQ